MVLADLNGDGLSDVLLIAGNRLYLEASYSQPDGQLGLPVQLFSVADRICDVVAGDVNQDGTVDLVVIGEGGRYQSFFGSFDGFALGPAGNALLLPMAPDCGVELVDVDGDGILDLSRVNPGGVRGVPQVSLGTGAGEFAASTSPILGTWEGAMHRFADVDGDGDQDLVSINSGTVSSGFSSATIVYGTGSLPLDPIGAVRLGNVAQNTVYRELLIEDEDGDGDLDLFFLRQYSNGSDVRVARQNSSGVLIAPVSVVADSVVFDGLRGVDLEGDGDLDVVLEVGPIAVPAAAFWYALRGAQSYGGLVPVAPNTKELSDVQVGDIDGDGLGEVLVTRVRDAGAPQLFDESFVELRRFDADPLGSLSDALALTVNDQMPYASSPLVAPLRAGGRPALFAVNRGLSRIVMLKSGHDGVFERGVAIPNSLVPFYQYFSLGDINGDGSTDILQSYYNFSNVEVRALFGDGQGGFGAPVNLFSELSSSANIYGAELLDLDSDGDLDFWFADGPALVLRGSLNDGSGQFGPAFRLQPGNPRTLRPRFADFNGDGQLDLAVMGPAGPEVGFGTGGGTFEEPQPRVMAPQGASITSVGDINKDGLDDLILRVTSGMTGGVFFEDIFVAQGRSDDAFEPATRIISGARNPDLLTVLDVDEDGDVDVVYGAAETATVELHINNGQGIFLSPESRALASAAQGGPNEVMSVADIDLDGDLDLVLLTKRFIPLSSSRIEVVENLSLGPVGSGYCGSAVPNSTGRVGELSAAGSDSATLNRLVLRAVELPRNAFGFFLTSRIQGLASSVPGSVGTLCLGGQIGRFIGQGQVQNSGPDGSFQLEVDLNAVPDPMLGLIVVQPGETWNFQGWHRDVAAAGGVTSNFTSALSIQFM